MNDAVFIPGEKAFYELSVTGPVSLLIRHRGTIQDPPKPAAYDATSQVSSSNYISNMQIGNYVYKLQTDTTLIIKQSEEFLIGKGGTISPYRTEKQLLAILPEYKSDLKSYIRQNRISLVEEADMIKLVKYCNSLKK
jgi:hypothetical protein